MRESREPLRREQRRFLREHRHDLRWLVATKRATAHVDAFLAASAEAKTVIIDPEKLLGAIRLT